MYAGAALGSEFCYCHTCRVDSHTPSPSHSCPSHSIQASRAPNGVMTCNDLIFNIALPHVTCLHATSSTFFTHFWMISWFDILGIPLHLSNYSATLRRKVFRKARLDLPIHLKIVPGPSSLGSDYHGVARVVSLHVCLYRCDCPRPSCGLTADGASAWMPTSCLRTTLEIYRSHHHGNHFRERLEENLVRW